MQPRYGRRPSASLEYVTRTTRKKWINKGQGFVYQSRRNYEQQLCDALATEAAGKLEILGLANEGRRTH